MESVFRHEVLEKYDVEYFKCNGCGFLFVEEPFWLDEAYEKSITEADTGLLTRNIDFSRKVAVLIYHHFKRNGVYLDYAGGYGVFTRLMRDAGFSFLHTDPYTENMFAREFEWDGSSKVDGVSCFECVEHLPNPLESIGEILSISKNLIFSTEVLPSPVPDTEWAYYSFEHGQHISFYETRTLEHIATSLGLHSTSVGGLHLFTEEPLPRRQIKLLLRKTNRAPYLFSNKTMHERVIREMKKRGER